MPKPSGMSAKPSKSINPGTAAIIPRRHGRCRDSLQHSEAEGKYDEASKLLQLALPIEERAYGAANSKVAVTLDLLVGVDEQRGKLDQAESDLTRMLSIERSVYGENSTQVTVVTANLGHLYLEKKQYARAEQLYREVVRRFTEDALRKPQGTGIVQIDLGRVLLQERRYQDAEAHSFSGLQDFGRA